MIPEFRAWAANTEDAIWVDVDMLLNKGMPEVQDEDGIYVDLPDAIGLADVLEGGAEMAILTAHARSFKKKG